MDRSVKPMSDEAKDILRALGRRTESIGAWNPNRNSGLCNEKRQNR
jgi:hypothetical protein